ncbi:PstS family phosphate ABC transporter substrate-binding protein [Spiroplasma endosymbiont of Aspidapion aeneum]|uniref:PstS family phosphate ABC transporter substrate-binding protein n=1 Tax=Spiroplasma endosymbiont of Aspidapion aeneum TaxID=3066276 RepID=UPI00313D40D2
MIGGSTSCNELMQAITNNYSKGEVIYSSLGSQAGINGYENKSISAGFVSKELTSEDFGGRTPKSIKRTSNVSDLVKNPKPNESISISFGKDALLIIYKAPKWWDSQLDNYLSFYTKSDSDTDWLSKIYKGDMSWEVLAHKIQQKHELKSINVPDTSTSFITYTRESGSGTRDAFSELTKANNLQKANVANSNNLMVQGVSANYGSIGYISYSFNNKITKKSGLHAAAINDVVLGNDQLGDRQHIYKIDNMKGLAIDIDFTNEDAIAGKKGVHYEFTRDFTILFGPNSKSINELLIFISWFINFDSIPFSPNAKKVYDEAGIVPICNIQIWD